MKNATVGSIQFAPTTQFGQMSQDLSAAIERERLSNERIAPAITTGGNGNGENPKEKFGVAKPAFGMIPSTALTHLAVVHALGAEKYGPYNWRESAISAMTYVSAAERHLRSWLDGEHNDPESGASHLAHVMACCAILIDAAEVGTLVDDRPRPAPTAELIAKLTKVLN